MNMRLSNRLSVLHAPKNTALIFLLTAAVLASLVLPAPLAAAEMEPGPCEWGLAMCVKDAIIMQFPSDFMITCLIGYAFCKIHRKLIL